MTRSKRIFVTGGAGYVGAVLIPKLLQKGYDVKVLDLFLYGEDVLDSVRDNPRLAKVKGDIRDRKLLEKEIPGYDTVIHLACISNDPSYELDPDLGKSINYDAFIHLVDVSKKAGVKKFIYASSSSVYWVKDVLRPSRTADGNEHIFLSHEHLYRLLEDLIIAVVVAETGEQRAVIERHGRDVPVLPKIYGHVA